MKCSFCDLEYGTGTGLTLFRKDGTPLRYCSRRCEKFYLMRRNPRKLKWTGRFVKYGGAAQTPAKAKIAPVESQKSDAPKKTDTPKAQKPDATAKASG